MYDFSSAMLFSICGWARSKLGELNFTRVCHRGCRNLSPWGVTCCLPAYWGINFVLRTLSWVCRYSKGWLDVHSCTQTGDILNLSLLMFHALFLFIQSSEQLNCPFCCHSALAWDSSSQRGPDSDVWSRLPLHVLQLTIVFNPNCIYFLPNRCLEGKGLGLFPSLASSFLTC